MSQVMIIDGGTYEDNHYGDDIFKCIFWAYAFLYIDPALTEICSLWPLLLTWCNFNRSMDK